MPEPSPGWFVDAFVLGLGVIVVVSVVLCLRGVRVVGRVRAGVAVLVALAGAAAVLGIWGASVEVAPAGADGQAVLCQYDPLSMAASSGPMTGADRDCRTDSVVRVVLGVVVALGTCGSAMLLTRRRRVRV